MFVYVFDSVLVQQYYYGIIIIYHTYLLTKDVDETNSFVKKGIACKTAVTHNFISPDISAL